MVPRKSEDSLDTQWITAFLAVLKNGSFDAAAKSLGCGQSTVTNRVSKLEGWLGASVFNRDERPTFPTKVGFSFIPVAENVMRQLEAFRAAIPKPAPVVHVQAEQPTSTELGPPATIPDDATNQEPAEAGQPRRGWWQRTFG